MSFQPSFPTPSFGWREKRGFAIGLCDPVHKSNPPQVTTLAKLQKSLCRLSEVNAR